MAIQLVAFNKNPNIGIFGRVNDRIAIVPRGSPRRFTTALEESLEVEVHQTNIAGTSLVGSLVAMNNSGLVVTRQASADEVKELKGLDMKVAVIKDKYTAMGNLLLLNDRGAIAGKGFGKRSLRLMADALDCEVVTGELGEFRTLGAIGIATNKGALVHPLVSEGELEWVEGILKVEVEVGTVNRGVGFVRTGIIANGKGLLMGNETTGPEITRIEETLGLL